MINLTFIRHAESEYNRKYLFQGQADCSCTIEGLSKVKELKKEFNETKYNYCYCSPLKRTSKTANILIKDLPIIYDDRLKEVALGEWEHTPITEEKLELYRVQKYIPKGGESKKELDIRVKGFLKMIRKSHNDLDNIFIVTHGGVIASVKRVLNIKSNGQIKNLDVFEVGLEKI